MKFKELNLQAKIRRARRSSLLADRMREEEIGRIKKENTERKRTRKRDKCEIRLDAKEKLRYIRERDSAQKKIQSNIGRGLFSSLSRGGLHNERNSKGRNILSKYQIIT